MDHLKQKQREINPEEHANFLTKLFFVYTRKTLVKGFRTDLVENDIYEVLPSYRSRKLGKKLENIYKNQKSDRKFSMPRFLWKCFGMQYLPFLAAIIIHIGTTLLRPKLIKKFLGHFSKNHTVTKLDGWLYGSYLLLVVLVGHLYNDNLQLRIRTFAIKMRTAFTSLIYRKVLKMNSTQLESTSVGKIITLITKDVDEFEDSISFVTYMLNSFVHFLVVCYVLYSEVGWLVITIVSVFTIVISLQVYLASLLVPLKTKLLKKTDERYQITKEILNGIKSLKCNVWGDVFKLKLFRCRKEEVCYTYKIFLLLLTKFTLSDFFLNVTWYLFIVCSIYAGDQINAGILFLVIDSLNAMSMALKISIPRGIYEIGNIIAVFKRMGNFLCSMEDFCHRPSGKNTPTPQIKLSNINIYEKKQKIRNKIDLTLGKGLSVITGSVGSGKTLLLKLIMKEHQFFEGEVTVNGSISYASQEPWLFPSTIKQNIVFAENYDEERYLKVINLCSLSEDLQCFDEGDNTIVIDRGNNLSGGQRSRINLARAIYRDSDIYLLDDCLSSLDILVANSIFEECVKGFLKNKLVVMVSQNQKYIDTSNTVIDMNNNATHLSSTTPKQAKSDFVKPFGGTASNWRACQYGGDDSHSADESDTLIAKEIQKIYQEKEELARVKLETYKKYLVHGGGIMMFSLISVLFICAQFSKTLVHKLQAKWINIEQNLLNYTLHNVTSSKKYENINQKRHVMIYIFPAVLTSTAILMMLRAIVFFLMTKKASVSIHKLVATKVINASMQFFDNHFVGNILNRFSEDFLYVDEKVSDSLFSVIECFVQTMGITILIATVNIKLILPSLVFCMVIATTTYMYLRTGRALKQLEISTRSPFVGYTNATTEGLPTIRASKAEHVLCDEFDRHLDLYTSASYMYVCCCKAYGFVLHMFSTVFIAIVIALLLIFRDDTSVGNVGLVLSQSFMLVQIQDLGFRIWAKLETDMTAVNRILEYTKQKEEAREGNYVANWPKSGDIRFEKMEFSYKNDANFVLKGINFSIKSGEKIAIVGRTGAGKTSLISTLLRLYKTQGKIYFDHVDIATLPLDLVRNNISMVPQNPFLFTGTIRENIDPLGKYTDEQVWNIIKTINLENLFCSLEHKISGVDCSLSMGQKQLICLGRVIIQSNKLVILDEVTANVDCEIETKIQQIIQTHFSHSTVIMITHKLNFIKYCDKIMVLDKGSIVEFDSPQILLKNDKGMLRKMYTVQEM